MTSCETKPKRSRRWLSFSIRGLLVVVTLLCIALGWIGKDIVRMRVEQSVVDELTKAGGVIIWYDYERNKGSKAPGFGRRGTPPGNATLRRWFGDHLYARVDTVGFRNPQQDYNEQVRLLPHLGDLRYVYLDWFDLEDESAAELAKVPRLRHIWFHQTAVTPRQFEILGQSESLREISLSGTTATDFKLHQIAKMPRITSIRTNIGSVTDEGLSALAQMSQLEKLSLDHATWVTDEGIAQLAELKQLKVFNTNSVQLTDQVLATIGGWPQLEELSIGLTPESSESLDTNLRHLAKLKQLKKLTLFRAQLTDHSLEMIVKLQELESLTLSDNDLTDAGLATLKQLPKLKTLGLCGNFVTTEGLQQLETFPVLETVVISEDVKPPKDISKTLKFVSGPPRQVPTQPTGDKDRSPKRWIASPKKRDSSDE